MKRQPIQRHIVESVIALPICVLATGIAWWLGNEAPSATYGWGLLACLAIAYVLMETCNSNLLIRVRTQIVPSMWLLCALWLHLLHPIEDEGFTAGLLALSYHQLCASYQKREATLNAFHIFLCLSLGSLFTVHLLWLAPFYWLYMHFHLRCLSARTAMASWVGGLLPYWCWLAYCIYLNDFTALHHHWASIVDIPNAFDFSGCTNPTLFYWAWISLLSAFSIIHFLRNTLDDKIKPRTLLHFFFCQSLLFQVPILFFPQYATTLLPLLTLSNVPLIGHYFAVSKNRTSNFVFCGFSLSLFFFLFYTIWTQS